VLEDVRLGDAPLAAAAGEAGRVDGVLLDELAGGRHEPRVLARGLGRRRRGRRNRRCGRAHGRRRGRSPGSRLRLGVDRRDHLASDDRAAVTLEHSCEHAIGGCG
jgi:hypothetical protein